MKLKEISYIHSEAYAAGELKHGPISLIEDGTLAIGDLIQNELYEKTLVICLSVRAEVLTCVQLLRMENMRLKIQATL